jgi:hypothetical protein
MRERRGVLSSYWPNGASHLRRSRTMKSVEFVEMYRVTAEAEVE